MHLIDNDDKTSITFNDEKMYERGYLLHLMGIVFGVFIKLLKFWEYWKYVCIQVQGATIFTIETIQGTLLHTIRCIGTDLDSNHRLDHTTVN